MVIAGSRALPAFSSHPIHTQPIILGVLWYRSMCYLVLSIGYSVSGIEYLHRLRTNPIQLRLPRIGRNKKVLLMLVGNK